LCRFDGEAWTTLLPDKNIRSLLEDANGNLWFGTARSGVLLFDGTNWTTFKQRRGMFPQIVDHAGDVWLASDRGGAFRFDGETWTQYTTDDGLSANIVFAVFEDSQHHLWFATAGGLSRLERN
jgi:ligand-binding sensor domain-containing protein